MKVAVLGGGSSPERDISLRSAKAVSEALQTAGFETLELDPSMSGVLEIIDTSSIVFPILHGVGGEDGSIQAQLEERNLPYLGSDSTSSKTCFDKGLAREAFQSANIPVAEGAVVTRATYESHPLMRLPHVLKVSKGGSSIGTYLVPEPRSIDFEKVDEVFELSNEAIVEELVEGVEVTIPVLDEKALPVIEIRPPAGAYFDYENKYNGRTQELCPPVSVNKAAQQQAQHYAERAHKALGCRHLSRVDMIIRPDNSMVLLEINTIPGMTDQSLYPKSALEAGLTFPQLVTHFVELVKRDYGL